MMKKTISQCMIVKNEEKNMCSSQNTYFKNRYKHAKQC